MARIRSTLSDESRKVTAEALQGALVDLIDLSLQAKQAHWNLVGRRFRSIHLQLDEVVETARRGTDVVAERCVAIGEPPDGRVATVAEQTGLAQVEAGWLEDDNVVTTFVDRYHACISRMRDRIAATEQPDPVSQDLFIEITAELEKQAWMFQAEQ